MSVPTTEELLKQLESESTEHWHGWIEVRSEFIPLTDYTEVLAKARAEGWRLTNAYAYTEAQGNTNGDEAILALWRPALEQ